MKSGQHSATATANRSTTIRNPQRDKVLKSRAEQVLVRTSEATSEETAVVNAVVIAANPVEKKANDLVAESQDVATTAQAALNQPPLVISEPLKTEAEINVVEATKAPKEPAVALQSARGKAIELIKVAVTLDAATRNPLADPNVHNHPRPHPGNPPQVRLNHPAQPPKTIQQKRNRCHIGNASPPCLD